MKHYESGEYRTTAAWPYALSAGCVIYRQVADQTEVILLKRAAGQYPQLRQNDQDTYHLPKGHMHLHESLEQTAVREAKEESGYDVELATLLGTQASSFDFMDMHQEKTIVYFAATVLKELPQIDHEHTQRVWHKLNEAMKLLGPPNWKHEDELLRRLKKFLGL